MDIRRDDDLGKFAEMVNYVSQTYPFIIGTEWMTYSQLRQIFNYIYDMDNLEFPYKTSQSFNRGLRSYTPWNHLFSDLGTTKEKIWISYPNEFINEVNEWYLARDDPIKVNRKQFRPRDESRCGLYALCQSGNNEEIKIGRISSYYALTQQYNTRYNSQGFDILRFWPGLNYYDLEHVVHNHSLLIPLRVVNRSTNRNTEWFRADIATIDRVVTSCLENNEIFVEQNINSKISQITDHNNPLMHIQQCKKLLSLLLGSIVDDGLEYIYSHFDKYDDDYFVTGDSKFEKTFYDLDPRNKALTICYLLTFVRVLGFKGIFDTSQISINKDALVQYLTVHRERIERLTQTKFTASQLTNKYVIQWLNSKLDPLLSVKIKRTNNDPDYCKYFLQSPWRIYISDKEPKILHYPTNTDITYDQYQQTFPAIMNSILNNALDKCYKQNEEYPGSIMITDLSMWNALINNNKEYKAFQQRAYELYQQNMLYKDYMKNNDNLIQWNDYISRLNISKSVGTNIVHVNVANMLTLVVSHV